MSAKVEALVTKNSQLRGSAKAVLLAIARLAPRDDGGGIYASVGTIAEQSGWSVDTVQRAFRKARDYDELAVYYNRGPNGTNHYQVRIDALTRRRHQRKDSPGEQTTTRELPPRKMRDKGSGIQGTQYSSKAKIQNNHLRDSAHAFAETSEANRFRTCPGCGRYGGRCDCDSALQASFDRAMREILDAGKPGRAQLASEEALQQAYATPEASDGRQHGVDEENAFLTHSHAFGGHV
jgi:Helix-turn-helix domain